MFGYRHARAGRTVTAEHLRRKLPIEADANAIPIATRQTPHNRSMPRDATRRREPDRHQRARLDHRVADRSKASVTEVGEVDLVHTSEIIAGETEDRRLTLGRLARRHPPVEAQHRLVVSTLMRLVHGSSSADSDWSPTLRPDPAGA